MSKRRTKKKVVPARRSIVAVSIESDSIEQRTTYYGPKRALVVREILRIDYRPKDLWAGRP